LFKYSDMTLTCNQCGKEFIFFEDEQEFYKTKGFTPPHRCKDCRSTRRQTHVAACSKCGNSFVEGAPIYCAACQVNSQLDFEIKAQALQSVIEETANKLTGTESEKARTMDLLQQKELQVRDLEQRLTAANVEIEKASRMNANLDWLGPALTSLNEKVSALENNQNNLVEALVQIIESKEEPQKVTGLVDTIRGLFRNNHRYPAQTT
jgi:septal ring factor EnvC (AmiA/AmiB activator)